MLKSLLIPLCLIAPFSVLAQSYEPKWIGEVNLLTIDKGDTISNSTEKANIKTSINNGFIICHEIVVMGAKSSLQVSPDKPFVLVVKCRDNDTDPSTFIKVIKFKERRKKRSAELSKVNLWGDYSRGNMALMPFTAESYGRSSYILTIQPHNGEFGVMVVNPNGVDEKFVILRCFGAHSEKTKKTATNSGPEGIRTGQVYVIDGLTHVVYKDASGAMYIYRGSREKYYLPADAQVQ